MQAALAAAVARRGKPACQAVESVPMLVQFLGVALHEETVAPASSSRSGTSKSPGSPAGESRCFVAWGRGGSRGVAYVVCHRFTARVRCCAWC